MDGDGVACISEYGLDGALLGEHFSKPISTNVRWMAPEVLSAESGGKRAASADDGKRADVYSFAVVMFEVGQPYSSLSNSSPVSLLSFLIPRSSPAPPHFPERAMRRLRKVSR